MQNGFSPKITPLEKRDLINKVSPMMAVAIFVKNITQ